MMNYFLFFKLKDRNKIKWMRSKFGFMIFLAGLIFCKNAVLVSEENQSAEKNDEIPGEAKIETEVWMDYQSSDEQSIENAEKKNIAKNLTGGILIEEIIEPSEGYNYAVFNRTDPFVPPYLKQRSLGDAEEPIVSVLQLHDLASLTVNGIWRSQQGEPKALIMTKNKEGVIVSLNDPVGNKNGKVVAIADQAVTIRQFSFSGDGSRQFEDFELALQTISYDQQGPQKLQLDSLNKVEDIEAQMREQMTSRYEPESIDSPVSEIGASGEVQNSGVKNPSSETVPQEQLNSNSQKVDTFKNRNFQP